MYWFENLVEVAHCLAAFAVQSSHGEIDLLQAVEDFRISRVWTRAGRCSITLARIPVPTFVGQAVR